ncbi:MAG: DUF3822 family protein [Flavobacteriaceae bacterium]
MPKENKIIQPKDLSIHYFVNGFSFCTHSKIDFIPTPKGASDFKKALEDFFDYYPKETFLSYSLIFYQNPSVFVPEKFFDNSRAKEYLELFKKTDETDAIAFDSVDVEENQINLYTFPKEIEEVLKQSNRTFKTTHYNTLLLRKIHSKAPSASQFDHQLFIHIQNNAMDVFLRNKSTLLFHNRFPISTDDEFLYYLFFVVEQFDLKADDFELIFMGKIIEFDSFYKAASRYHDHCTFMSETNQNPDLATHQAPFLASYFC